MSGTHSRFTAKNGLDANSFTLVNMADPVGPQDGCTKNFLTLYAQPTNVNLTALSGLATTGLISRTGAGAVVSRSLAGTGSQIDVLNPDGLGGNPTVNLSSNLTLPGAEKFTWPDGTTAQRPVSPVNGDSRYNTDLNVYEQYSLGVWNAIPKMPTVLGAVQARRTTTLVTTTTAVDITFDVVDVATNTAICNRDVTNTNRFYAYTAGTYEFNVQADIIASNAASLVTLQFQLNGTTLLPQGSSQERPASTTSRDVISMSMLVTLAANDYITIQALHTSNSVTLQIGTTVLMKKLDGVAGANGAQGAMGGSNSLYYGVASMDSPNNANWAINALAPIQADPTNTAINVRAFDDTAEEGCGATIAIPATATNITLKFTYRPATAPATAKGVVLHLYNRNIPINAAVAAWSTATTLTTVNIPVNAYFQTMSQTFTLASLGIAVGGNNQIEITRHGANVLDTLVGDFYMLDMTIGFS